MVDIEFKTQRERDSFLSKFVKLDSNECWIWSASKLPTGYGQFWMRGRPHGAHRVAFTNANGQIGDGMLVLHHCDNPSCVNPRHLFLGTQDDNMKDMTSKGRQSRLKGNLNPRSKLSNFDVLFIKEWDRAGCSRKNISEAFGVSLSTVSSVVNCRTWSHLS